MALQQLPDGHRDAGGQAIAVGGGGPDPLEHDHVGRAVPRPVGDRLGDGGRVLGDHAEVIARRVPIVRIEGHSQVAGGAVRRWADELAVLGHHDPPQPVM